MPHTASPTASPTQAKYVVSGELELHGLTAEDDTSQLRAEVKTTLADSAVVVTEDAVTILGATTRDTILAPPTRRHLLQDTVLVVQYEIATATEAIAEVVVANINAASFDDLKTYVRGNINPGATLNILEPTVDAIVPDQPASSEDGLGIETVAGIGAAGGLLVIGGAVLAYRKMSNGGRKDGSEQKVEESTFELSNIGGDGGMTSLSNVKMDDDMDLPSGVV